jgi:S1-C subfamily serine protease
MTRQLLLMAIIGAARVDAEMSAQELMDLAGKVRPSVMFIQTADDAGHPVATGTGFIVSDDGKLVTNQHVVKTGTRLTARAPGGRQYKVTAVLIEDKEHDLAVVQIENSRQPALPLGRTDELRAGTPVVVVGNPLGLESTVQAGNVTGFRKFLGSDRCLEITGPVIGRDGEFHREIIHGNGRQVVTDLAPGSSGSPVVDADGKVLGVVAAANFSGTPTVLAVPVEAVKELLARVASGR